jgi:glycosyltransferase involved in cell wall biosynthesis
VQDAFDLLADPDLRPLLSVCSSCPHYQRRTLRRSPPSPGKEVIRVGLACQGWYEGGVEEWFRCLVQGNTDTSIEFVAIGLVDLDGAEKHLKIDIPIVPHDELHNHCDLILAWCTDLGHLRDWPGKIVFIAHCADSSVSEAVARNSGLIDALVAVSSASRDAMGVDAAEVLVIRNGVDLDRLITPGERAVKSPRIGYLGRWSGVKRPHHAAEAAAMIGCRAAYLIPDDKLDIAKSETSKYGVEIDWYTTPQLKEFMATISCLIIPSQSEGGPLVAVEAWASGVPVAATQVGLIPELEAEIGPLTIPLSNPPTRDDLRSILDRINPTVTARAHQLARERLTTERMSREYAALFRRLIPLPTAHVGE